MIPTVLASEKLYTLTVQMTELNATSKPTEFISISGPCTLGTDVTDRSRHSERRGPNSCSVAYVMSACKRS
jgi:hypothetical protein